MTPKKSRDIAQWIVSEGLDGADELELLRGVSERLVAAGVPLLRTNISQPTLHPIVGGHLFIWRRDQAPAHEDWQRNVAIGYSQSPFSYMITSDETRLRRRLKEGEPSEFPMLDEFRRQGGTDYFAIETAFGDAHRFGPADRILSSWLADGPGGFRDTDIAAIEQIAPSLALAVKSASTYRIARSVIEIYLGRDAGGRVVSGEIDRGSGQTIRAALWYCDLQGLPN